MSVRFALTASRRRFVITLGALGLAALWPAWVGMGSPPLWAFWAHRAITEEITRQGIPGLSVAVVTDDRLRWASAYGLADVENGVPARVETVYRLASISKPITAVAVLRLAEQGKLNLDAPVWTYVPTFPAKPWPVTCRQLLAHLGGIRGYRPGEMESVRPYARLVDALAVFRDDPLECAPGTRHLYSTFGYNLLGTAIEGAAGGSYLDYVTRNIFQPAGMTRAGVADHDAIISGRARGYRKGPDGRLRNSRPADLSVKVPGGGLRGTVVDLARFAIALRTGRLVRPATLRAMFTPQRTVDCQPIPYGLGWSLSRHDGRAEVWHTGHQPQVSTLLYLQPERRVAVALMANLEGAQLLDLARAIADAAAP